VPITASLAVWFDRCPVRPTVIRAETRNSYRLPRRRLADFIDCRWHRHTARKARIVNGERAKFFKRQVLASSSLLHSLLPDRRDNDIISSLRNAKPFYSFRTRTHEFFLNNFYRTIAHIDLIMHALTNFQVQLPM